MLCTLIQMFHRSIIVILTTALYFLPERQRAEKANGVRLSSQALYFETRFGSWHLFSSRPLSAVCCCQQKKVFRQAAVVPLQLAVLLPSHVTGQNNLSRSSGTQLSLDAGVHVEGKTKCASCALIKQNCPHAATRLHATNQGHPGYAARFGQGPCRTVILCHTSTKGAESLSKSHPTHNERPVPPQLGQANLSQDSVSPRAESAVDTQGLVSQPPNQGEKWYSQHCVVSWHGN